MTRSQLAEKIDRALSGDRDTIFLTASEWVTVLEALREPRRADAMGQEYVLPASASHGSR